MDPLSVSASVVGILAAAASVASTLTVFVKNTKNASNIAKRTLSEVTTISVILNELQSYVSRSTKIAKARGSLILVEQVLIVLTECVTSFSDLEKILATLKTDTNHTLVDRIKWALKESKISAVTKRLESDKISLTLMLTILQTKSQVTAESSSDRLCTVVEAIFENNQQICHRLRGLETRSRTDDPPDPTVNNAKLSIASHSLRSKSPVDESSCAASRASTSKRRLEFAFEEDLQASKVYKRTIFSQSGASLVTSYTRSTANSVLSGLSISNVSTIAVFALPVYSNDLFNSHRYNFGDFNLVVQETEAESPNVPDSETITSRRKGLTKKLRSTWQRRTDSTETPEVKVEAKLVFGAPLEQSIKVANNAIMLTDENGESYIYGYVPFVIAKSIVYLKDRSHECQKLFVTSGNPRRLESLFRQFSSPPKFGRGLDWSGYTVFDAAGILLRFLDQLPEPIISITLYERFQDVLRRKDASVSFQTELPRLLREYKHLIALLPASNRQLLIYILDFLAILASRSEQNNLTLATLAAIFQPAILSPVTNTEMCIEDEQARRLSQDVIISLIENQGSFLFDIPLIQVPSIQKQEEEASRLHSKLLLGPPMTNLVYGIDL